MSAGYTVERGHGLVAWAWHCALCRCSGGTWSKERAEELAERHLLEHQQEAGKPLGQLMDPDGVPPDLPDRF